MDPGLTVGVLGSVDFLPALIKREASAVIHCNGCSDHTQTWPADPGGSDSTSAVALPQFVVLVG